MAIRIEASNKKNKKTQRVFKDPQGLSAEPRLNYFEPLMQWLKKQNEGREYMLPKL